MVAMSAAVTLGMGIALIANHQLMDWSPTVEFSIGGLDITRSVLSFILTWLLCLATLLIPIILPLIPFSRSSQKQMA
jgi:hypothetical protein